MVEQFDTEFLQKEAKRGGEADVLGRGEGGARRMGMDEQDGGGADGAGGAGYLADIDADPGGPAVKVTIVL